MNTKVRDNYSKTSNYSNGPARRHSNMTACDGSGGEVEESLYQNAKPRKPAGISI